MPTRIRTRGAGGGVLGTMYRHQTGSAATSGIPYTNTSSLDISTKCTDNPPGMFKQFEVDIRERFGDPWSFTEVNIDNPSVSHTYQKFWPLRMSDINDSLWSQIYDIPGNPTNGAAATELLEKTNPSRPLVSIPNFGHELRELPSMLYRAGRGLIRGFAGANLQYQFGWKPLVSDLGKMLSFTDEVTKRSDELKALASGGLRRKRTLWRGSRVEDRGYQPCQSGRGFTMSMKIQQMHVSHVWGYVDWYPTSPMLYTDNEFRGVAQRALMGLTIDPSTVWEAVPWSWLVDYFSNVGDYLAAHRNIVGASYRNLSIMRRSSVTSTASHPSYPKRGVTTFARTLKTRTPASASLDAQLPFLSGRQFSILGSLSILRLRGSR